MNLYDSHAFFLQQEIAFFLRNWNLLKLIIIKNYYYIKEIKKNTKNLGVQYNNKIDDDFW